MKSIFKNQTFARRATKISAKNGDLVFGNYIQPIKGIILVFSIAVMTVIGITSCNKITPGFPPLPFIPNSCDIVQFDLQDIFIGNAHSRYPDILQVIMTGDARMSIFDNGRNIQYNALDQPILATGLEDSVYVFKYDALNRLSDLTLVEPAEISDSLFLYHFGYKTGSTAPDSLFETLISHFASPGESFPYTLIQTYEYDVFNRLSKVFNFNFNSKTIYDYQRLVYAAGNLQAVYRGFPTQPGESVVISFQSYDHHPNCMLSNPVWLILSGMYSINNPTKYTINLPDNFQQQSLSYQYLSGLPSIFPSFPTSFFNSTSNIGPPDGTITYACGPSPNGN